jgi:hypothetical protein
LPAGAIQIGAVDSQQPVLLISEGNGTHASQVVNNVHDTNSEQC